MFDVGFWELLMIGMIGLLVVGPERLPEFARTIGRWVGQAQRMVRSVRQDIERELETENLRNMITQQEEQIQQLKGMVDEVRDDAASSAGLKDVKNDFSDMQQELRDGLREAKTEVTAPATKTGSSDSSP